MKLYKSKVVAEWLAVTPNRVRQLRDAGVIVEKAPDLYELKASVARYIDYLRKRNTNLNEERAMLTRAKREAANMENDLRRGTLCSMKEIEDGLTTLAVQLMALFEQITGAPVDAGGKVRLFLSWMTSAILLLMAQANRAANQNLPRFASGENLDELAELFHDVQRPRARAAGCRMRFTISEPQAFAVLIPKGTRVTDAGSTLVSRLISMLMTSGIKRVELRSPVFVPLRDGAPGLTATAEMVPQAARVRSVNCVNGGYEDD